MYVESLPIGLCTGLGSELGPKDIFSFSNKTVTALLILFL